MWMKTPNASGIYWAYKRTGTNPLPSLCKVKMLDNDSWRATFITGGTYTFTESGGWHWLPQKPPAPPALAGTRS